VLRDFLPSIVHPVNIRDWNLRQLFLGHSFKAANVDAVHPAHGRFIADAEWPHTAFPAEQVLVLSCIE
jgi:hypothetical protein